jgi:hypothetical protein
MRNPGTRRGGIVSVAGSGQKWDCPVTGNQSRAANSNGVTHKQNSARHHAKQNFFDGATTKKISKSPKKLFVSRIL